MPGMMEPQQVGKKQDLSNYITNIQREDTPLFTIMPKDTVSKTTFETQVDDYGDTDDLAGVGSAEDADSFQNESENRGIIENSVMKMWEKPGVDDFAENVNENPGLQEGEYANSVRKATVRLKFRCEKRLMSEHQATKQDGTGTKYGTCSIGGFLSTSAPSGTQVIPTRYRLPSAHAYASTLATLTEENIHDILQEIFEQTHGAGDFVFPCGSELKQKVSSFSFYRPDLASNSVVRNINSENNKTLQQVVDFLVGDFGRVKLMPVTRMRWQTVAGAATSATLRRGSGYILDLKMWGLAFKRKPGHKRLEDKGGGPRGIVDMIFGLRCKNPLGNGRVSVSS
jgi:hypothetical protein